MCCSELLRREGTYKQRVPRHRDVSVHHFGVFCRPWFCFAFLCRPLSLIVSCFLVVILWVSAVIFSPVWTRHVPSWGSSGSSWTPWGRRTWRRWRRRGRRTRRGRRGRKGRGGRRRCPRTLRESSRTPTGTTGHGDDEDEEGDNNDHVGDIKSDKNVSGKNGNDECRCQWSEPSGTFISRDLISAVCFE